MMRRATIPLALCVLLAWNGSLAAETAREQARALLREGNRLHDKGDYVGALERFRAARKLFLSYKIVLNIATSLDKLGRRAEAAEAFEQFLREAPANAPPQIVQRTRRRLGLLQGSVASVSVTSNIDGARVMLDGVERGRTPTAGRLYLEPGAHRLEVSHEGYTTYGAHVQLSRGDHRDLTVELRPMVPALPVQPRSTAALGRTRTRWAYVTLGTGAALAVGAAVLYGVGVSHGNAAHDDYAAARDQEEMDRHWENVEAAKTKVLVGHVLAGTAAAALGASAYLFLTRPAEQPVSSVGVVPGPGGGMVVLRGSY